MRSAPSVRLNLVHVWVALYSQEFAGFRFVQGCDLFKPTKFGTEGLRFTSALESCGGAYCTEAMRVSCRLSLPDVRLVCVCLERR